MKKWKLLKKALSNTENLRFGDMVTLVKAFGFGLDRTSGSHHIFSHTEMDELLNLQEVKGKAKSYQIRQFIKLIERYGLDQEDDE